MNGLTPRRFGPVVALLLLGTSAAACTGGSGKEPAPASSSSSAPLAPSAPMRVSVTHVAGRLSPSGRAAVSAGVRRTLSSYVEEAFLSGRYPRTDFRDSFGSFTPGTVAAARRDADLLTNASLGASTTSVRAIRRTAYLSVLAPKQRAAGVTAAVDLTFLVARKDEPAQRVRLRGRLLLTRGASGRWAVFGYDVNRSQTTGSGS